MAAGKVLSIGGCASRTFVRHTKEDFAQCAWMRLYTNPETRKPGTTLKARWVKGFRLPIDMFDEVLERLRGAGVSDSAKTFGSYTAPLELKLMATLRWLASTNVLSGCRFVTVGGLMRPSSCSSPASRRNCGRCSARSRCFFVTHDYCYKRFLTVIELNLAVAVAVYRIGGCLCHDPSSEYYGATM